MVKKVARLHWNSETGFNEGIVHDAMCNSKLFSMRKISMIHDQYSSEKKTNPTGWKEHSQVHRPDH